MRDEEPSLPSSLCPLPYGVLLCPLPSALRSIYSPPRCPRSAPRHPLDRAPSSSHHAVARDHNFCVAAARGRKAAAIAGRRSGRGQVVLIEVDRADRDPRSCGRFSQQSDHDPGADQTQRTPSTQRSQPAAKDHEGMAIKVRRNQNRSAYSLTPGTINRPPLTPLRIATTCSARMPIHANTSSRLRTQPSPKVARLTMLVTST